MTNLHSATTHILCALALAGCKANVNIGDITDTNSKDTDTTAESTDSGNGGATTSATTTESTGTTGTTKPAETTETGDPVTTEPVGTTGPGETTGNGNQTTGNDTTGGASTSGGTTTSDGTTTSGTTTGGASTGGGEGPDGWTKYREILIDNGLATKLSDFQVFVNLPYDNDMSPDFADLRFTDATGQTTLPHWVESYTAPVNASIWVRVPVIAPDDITTIRVYYGNPGATDVSDGKQTFLFFDDFLGAALDAKIWKATAPTTVDFGELKITKGSVYAQKPLSAYPDTMFESRMQWQNEGNVSGSCLGADAGQGAANVARIARCHGSVVAYDGQKYLGNQQVQDAGNEMAIMGIAVNATDFYFYKNRFPVPTIISGSLSFSYYGILGHPWGNAAGMQETQDINLDWVLVRRFNPQEPDTFVGGEKQP